MHALVHSCRQPEPAMRCTGARGGDSESSRSGARKHGTHLFVVGTINSTAWEMSTTTTITHPDGTTVTCTTTSVSPPEKLVLKYWNGRGLMEVARQLLAVRHRELSHAPRSARPGPPAIVRSPLAVGSNCHSLSDPQPVCPCLAGDNTRPCCCRSQASSRGLITRTSVSGKEQPRWTR